MVNSNKAPVTYDLAIIGGGLHGVTIALEAAHRGLSTVVFQASDIISEAANPIDNIAENLLRLEKFQLGLINNNLQGVHWIRTIAPHTASPILSYISKTTELRTPTKVKTGINIFHRWLKRKKIFFPKDSITQTAPNALFSTNDIIDKPFQDIQLNYNRLAIAITQYARTAGAEILPRTLVDQVERFEDHWQIHTKDKSNSTKNVKAKVLFNASGWAAQNLIDSTLKLESRGKASYKTMGYVFVKQRSDKPIAQHALQLKDKSLLYYAQHDSEHCCLYPIPCPTSGIDDKECAIEKALHELNKAQSNIQFTKNDIAYTRWRKIPTSCAVDDGNNTDFEDAYLDLSNPGNLAPAVTLFGSNTFQLHQIAEQALNLLEPFTTQTHHSDIEGYATDRISVKALSDTHPYLPQSLCKRLAETYGNKLETLVGGLSCKEDLGRHFGHQLYEFEVKYLINNEWAITAADIIWRRTFLGLKFSQEQVTALDAYLNQ